MTTDGGVKFAQEARPISPVDRALADLDVQLNELTAEVGSALSKLEPVLRPAPPSENVKSSLGPIECQSPVVESINQMTGRLARLRERLAETVNRLEI